MSFYSYIKLKYLNPLQAIQAQWYYSAKKTYNSLNDIARDHHIVVSLTSFPARFETLHFALKSILNQSMKPDVIFLCLTKDEVKDETELPQSVLELKKYGLQIYFADDNFKPHNKYYYAMKLYPNSLVITVDDDNIYDRNLVADLYSSFQKYPSVVSARRVHKIIKDKKNTGLPYRKWCHEYKKEKTPSHDLLATGVGGVLYPPGLLPPETFDADKIRELCLNADDIWLKFMELKNNIPVVWVRGRKVHPLKIRQAQKITLYRNNYYGNLNDRYIADLQNYYGVNL
ncbi:MAG: glycosyltransferase [Treponema sp.]|nr:glycosyltransferase [Treponema sp.]